MKTRRLRLRFVVLPVVGLALLLIALALLLREPEGPEAPVATAKPVPPPAEPAAPTPPRPKAVVAANDLAQTQRLLQDPNVVATYLERYKEANRYAPTTVPLVPGMKDVLQPDVVPVRDMPMMGVRNLYTKPEHRLYYRFETDKFRYVAPEPVQLRLSVYRGEQKHEPVAVKVGAVSVHRLQPSGRHTVLGTVALKETSPGEYSATYLPPKRKGAEEDDLLQFEVSWEFTDGELKPARERALVQYTAFPPAAFTGRFLERLENGSLFIDAEVESQREGTAQVAGNLFAADGTTPVAVSVVPATLKRGHSWVTLEFYGLVFHDRGVPGPYVLKTLRGHFPSSASAGRGAEFSRFGGSHTTRGYELSAFTQKEWDSPRKQAGLKAYEDELARLRASSPLP